VKKDKRSTPYYDVKDATGKLLIRVANYQNPIVEETDGVGRLLDYLKVFVKELEQGKWASFIFDSVSFASLGARKWHQYELNPDTENPLQWYGGAADLIEELLCLQLPALPCNVGVAFHVHRRKIEAEGAMVRQPFVPGKRLEETKMVSAAWPELYRMHVKEEDGKRRRYLQTECNAKYQAGTCIGLPDDLLVPRKVEPEFLWQGWRGKGARPPVHIGIYSDPHVGKSTFLAGVMPRPVYVALFDMIGKDNAYRLLGTVDEEPGKGEKA
jgi:hypothetical protein